VIGTNLFFRGARVVEEIFANDELMRLLPFDVVTFSSFVEESAECNE
jgi:hypothetical protein